MNGFDPGTTALVNRALLFLIGVCVTIIVYFLKKVADDIKEWKAVQDEHTKMLVGHNIMYEVWLDDVLGTKAGPKRRKVDRLKEALENYTEESTHD